MDDRLVVLRLAGEWDIYRSEELERLLKSVRDVPRVVLDMTHCRYVDCTFLGQLVSLRKYRHANGLQVSRIVLQSPAVKRVFDVAGFTALWPICATVEQALYSFDLPVPA
jgi:anti-anti-sigma factor